MLLILATGLLYGTSAATHVLGGDNAEFVALAQGDGVAHPSGYPLFVLYLRALAWLPASSPPHASALATALLGSATVGMLYIAGRRWGAAPFPTALSCALYSLSPRAWTASSHAEVFALNALLASTIIALCARTAGKPRQWRLPLLGVVAGLAVANHLSSVLLAPLGLCAVGLGLADLRHPGRRAALTGLAFVVGLLPYFTLLGVEAAVDNWSWGEAFSATDLARHFLRTDYGTLELGLTDQGGKANTHILSWLSTTLEDLLWLPIVAVPLGVALLWRRAEAGPARSARLETIAWVTTLMLSGPVFIGAFNLSTNALSLAVVQRFYLLPELVTALLLSLGLHTLLLRVMAPLRRVLLRPLGALTFLGLTLSAAASAWPEVKEHHSPAVETYLRNVLQTAPPKAVILGTGDHRLFGFDYLRSVPGLRRDVVYVDPRLLHYSWYHRRMEKRLGFELPRPRDGNLNTAVLAQAIVDQRRPLLLTNPFSAGISEQFLTSPLGLLQMVHPRGELPLAPHHLVRVNLALLARYDLSYPVPRSNNSWAQAVHAEYARPLTSLAQAFENAGQLSEAKLLQEQAAPFLNTGATP